MGVTIAGIDIGRYLTNSTIQPFLENNNSLIILESNTYGNFFLTGQYLDNNISVEMGNAVIVESIEAINPTKIKVNYRVKDTTQTLRRLKVKRGLIESFGDNIDLLITRDTVGMGGFGDFITDFNNGNSLDDLLKDWNIVVGSAISSADIFFKRSNSGTPSNGTGAKKPYDSYYLFTERSGSNNGANTDCYIETDNFRKLTEISFRIHKFANSESNMSDLVIYSKNKSNVWEEKWRHTGNIQNSQNDDFSLITLDTSLWGSKAIRIAFENATNWQSDICLDNIKLTSIDV